MPENKIEQERAEENPVGTNKLGPDVYESARKLNLQLATKGPAILYALSKASEPLTNSNVVTAVGSMVIGAFSFFGNRFYRQKGDDSAYSYMGQMVGGVQFTTGFLLLAVEALQTYTDSGEAGPLLKALTMAGVALTVTESAIILINSYLFGDSSPKTAAEVRPKMN